MRLKILIGILKIYAPPFYPLYFKRFKVNNRKNIPCKGPVIFAPNHQNAFMDAILIGGSTCRGPWFLTRASVFKHPVARALLTSMQMLPIYRFRDGLEQVKRNDEIIESCIRMMHSKGSLLIFPEGNHDLEWRLRPLQKGIARISFAAESEAAFKLGLKILPVGLQYENLTKFRSDALLNFGEPIELGQYKEAYEKDPAQAYDLFLADLAEKMEKLIVHIDTEMDHDKVKKMIQTAPGRPKKLIKRFEHDRDLVQSIKDNTFVKADKPKTSIWKKLMDRFLAIVGFPVFVYAVLNHLPFILLTQWIVKTKIKDPNFIASIKFALGIFLIPLGYIIQGVIVYILIHDSPATLYYLLSLPVTGLLGYHYFDAFLRNKNP